MSENPFVKSLHLFDPRKDLSVNESFRTYGMNSMANTLEDLEFGDEMGEVKTGKEYCSIKTGDSVLSGVVEVPYDNKKIILGANQKGEIYFLEPKQKSFNVIAKSKIQGSIIKTPAYVDGVAYCTTREGLIYAIYTDLSKANKIAKPKVLWRKKLRKGILSEPIATGKILIVVSLNGIYGFEAYFKDKKNKSIGRPLWRLNMSGTVSTPAIHSGIIYIGSEDKHLYAIGYGGNKVSKIWSYELSDAVRAKACVSESGDMVIVPTIDGNVYSIGKKSGNYKWNFIVKSPVMSNIVSSKNENKEYFYFGADNGIFYCLDSYGKKVWSFKTNDKIRSEALVEGDRVFFGSEDNNLYVLNKLTGKLLLKFGTDGNIEGKPVLLNDILYFGSSDSFIHGIHL